MFFFSLHYFRDLISEDGITLEIGEEYEEDEDFAYTPAVQFSNDEILDMLNMNDFDDEEGEEDNEQKASISHIAFDKLRTRMTSLTPDNKVNYILFLFFQSFSN